MIEMFLRGTAMAILIDNMQWVLLACGVLTSTMIQAVFFPNGMMRAYFGETASTPAAEMLMRNWGVLVVIGGVFLVYAAFTPAIRPAALLSVGAGKLAFITLMLSQPSRFLKGQGLVAVIIDTIMVALFAAYLWATPAA